MTGTTGWSATPCWKPTTGSQVQNEILLQKAMEVGADAVLVSQVVTQKNVHIQNLTELIEMAEAEDCAAGDPDCGGLGLIHPWPQN